MNQICIFFLLLVCTFGAGVDGSCPVHYWGNDCINYCGHCSDPEESGRHDQLVLESVNSSRLCEASNGHCSTPCVPGWRGDRCDQAICKYCRPEECVGPNKCENCGSIDRVSGKWCKNIRLMWFLEHFYVYVVLIAILLLFTYLSRTFMNTFPE